MNSLATQCEHSFRFYELLAVKEVLKKEAIYDVYSSFTNQLHFEIMRTLSLSLFMNRSVAQYLSTVV